MLSRNDSEKALVRPYGSGMSVTETKVYSELDHIVRFYLKINLTQIKRVKVFPRLLGLKELN